ncbi:MAG: hypothetical protein AAGU27_24865 [Dehalobacterium sp.]
MSSLEHPDVTSAQRTGYPAWQQGREGAEYPHCPVCGAGCQLIFKNRDGACVGCEVCVETEDAMEVDACFFGGN